MYFRSSIVAALTVAASATNYESHVEIFSGENCQNHMLDRTLKTGDCHSMKLDLLVPEITNQNLGHVKHSGDDPNEVYFFPSKAACEEYGDSFNEKIEIVFVRAPGRDNCYSIVRGGNAKSIRFTAGKAQAGTPDQQTPADNGDVENKSADSTTLVASSLLVLAASTLSSLF